MTIFDGMATLFGEIALTLIAVGFGARMFKRAWLEVLPAIAEMQQALERYFPPRTDISSKWSEEEIAKLAGEAGRR